MNFRKNLLHISQKSRRDKGVNFWGDKLQEVHCEAPVFASCSLFLSAAGEILEQQVGAPKEVKPLGAATFYPDKVGILF